MEARPTFVSTRATRLGAIVFGVAITAWAVQNLLGAETVLGLEPLPKWLPGFHVWAVLNSLVLLGAGVGIVAQQMRRRNALVPAAALGGLLLLWILLLQVRVLIAHATDGSYWGCLFETVAVDSAAWVLAGLDAAAGPGTIIRLGSWGRTSGRIGYGISLFAFGGFHLLYPKYIASVVPSWLPGHVFWCYFAAAAFFAAGAAIVSGIKARWAAFWTGVMVLSWVPLVHLPRVLNAPKDRDEWTSLIVALAVGGGGWVLAESFSQPRVTAGSA